MKRIFRIFAVLLFVGSLLNDSTAQSDADLDFQSRCNASGVVKCLSFDGNAGVFLMGAAEIDNEMMASGSGSMKVQITPSAGESPGNIVTDLGGEFAEGSSLYLQWRQRFSPEMIDVDLGGEGFKQFVIYDGTPCGPNMEVAMLNQNYNGFPIFYSACGRSYFRRSLGGGEFALMWNEDGTICTNQDQGSCLRYQPDQWMTFYYEQHIGEWGQPNSTVKVWMSGENQPLQQIIDYSDYTFDSDNENSAYRDIWIGPFSMGRTANQDYPTATTWFDEFIISTEPIAEPLGTGTSIRNPDSKTSGQNNLNVQAHPVSAGTFTISFPNTHQNANVVIFDVQGNEVKQFSRITDNSVQWTASETGKGVYLLKVNTGNQQLTQKITVLK